MNGNPAAGAASQGREVLLDGQSLGEQRHVCVLFSGESEFDTLLHFLADGVARRERAIWIVAPGEEAAARKRLTDMGLDSEAATSAGLLKVLGWDDGLLQQGPFSPSASYAYVRQRLADGRADGFSRSRYLTDMGWALAQRVSLPDLVTHEGRVDQLARRIPDAIVCAYDVSRHSAGTISAVLGVHALVYVGGELRMAHGHARPATPRERLVSAASGLFQERGVGATAVDAIIERAGVAKATFYRHFSSKDDLVIAWLRDPRSRWWNGVRDKAASATSDPVQLIPLLFEGIAEWLEDSSFRGCPYINTAIELAGQTDPARTIVRQYLDEVEEYLRGQLERAGYPDAGIMSRELQTLMFGAVAMGAARRTAAYALVARDAAQTMLDCAERREAPP